MKMMHAKFTVSSRNSGLTLIEVLVGLAILSTLLVSLIVAQRRHREQLQAARKKIDACQAADELLTGWFLNSGGLPLSQAGRVPNNRDLQWRTRIVPSKETRRVGVDLVRLTIHSANTADGKSGNLPPLVSVDVVVPQVAGAVQ
jgi:type II secretion system protein I